MTETIYERYNGMLSKKRFTIVGTNLQHAPKIHFRGIVITHLEDKYNVSIYIFM